MQATHAATRLMATSTLDVEYARTRNVNERYANGHSPPGRGGGFCFERVRWRVATRRHPEQQNKQLRLFKERLTVTEQKRDVTGSRSQARQAQPPRARYAWQRTHTCDSKESRRAIALRGGVPHGMGGRERVASVCDDWSFGTCI